MVILGRTEVRLQPIERWETGIVGSKVCWCAVDKHVGKGELVCARSHTRTHAY